MTQPFQYFRQGRSPATYLSLWLAMVTLEAMRSLEVPALAWAAALAALGAVLLRLIANPVTGFQFDDRVLQRFAEGEVDTVALADIRQATIAPARGRVRSVTFDLVGGAVASLPCARGRDPDRLAAE